MELEIVKNVYFNTDDLDIYERRVFDDLVKRGSTKEKALEVLIT